MGKYVALTDKIDEYLRKEYNAFVQKNGNIKPDKNSKIAKLQLYYQVISKKYATLNKYYFENRYNLICERDYKKLSKFYNKISALLKRDFPDLFNEVEIEK